jgi:hypothetical protein
MSAVNNVFDTPQHMYRAAILAYRKHGWDGVTAVLAPSIAGAVAGSMAGNPEMGAIAADATAGEVAAAAGEAAATEGAMVPATDVAGQQLAELGSQIPKTGPVAEVPTDTSWPDCR